MWGSFGPDVSSFRFGRRTQELRSVAARHDFSPVGELAGFWRLWLWFPSVGSGGFRLSILVSGSVCGVFRVDTLSCFLYEARRLQKGLAFRVVLDMIEVLQEGSLRSSYLQPPPVPSEKEH